MLIEFFDGVVNVTKCYLGRVVAKVDPVNKTDNSKWKLAHITGFARNEKNELFLRLRVEDGDGEQVCDPFNCVFEI